MEKYNPYLYMVKLFGFLFYPLIYIKKVKEDFLPIIKLVNKLFINNTMMTFLAIWYPFIFISILSNVDSPQFMVFNIASFVPIVVGVQVMPVVILNLKNSSILKRIGATETKTSDVTLSIIFYFTIVSLASTFANLGLGILMYKSSINLEIVDWGSLILGMTLGTVVSMAFGIFLAGIIKSQQTLLVVGLLLTLPGAFLTSQFLPPSMVNEWGPVKYISFVFPQRLAASFTQISANGGSIFDFNDLNALDYSAFDQISENLISGNVGLPTDLPNDWSVQDYISHLESNESPLEFLLSSKTEIILTWALTPVYILGFSGMATKTFAWTTRG